MRPQQVLVIAFQVALGVFFLSAAGAEAQRTAESKNMRLLAQHDLNGHGDGGEGLAIQQLPDGRRLLYLAHEGTETCVSILDVSNPKSPMLVNQLPSPGRGVARCNSLSLSGDVLAIANQVNAVGREPAGMWLLDVSDFGRVQKAKSLEDLKLSFFDTHGKQSRGVHWLWFVDGEFAHLATGAADFSPTNALDDQFYMVVDVRDRKNPREVGRWWLPGTQTSDRCLPGCLPKRHRIDDGYRPHNIEVFPDRPERAYVGYVDGGMMILDISGLADVRARKTTRFTPALISRLQFSPPFTSWTHSVQPLPARGLAAVSDEATLNKCEDAPKLIWLVDIREETNPVIVGTAPLPQNVAELCTRGGRFGAHNLQPNFPSSTVRQLRNTFVGSFFNGGVRIYRVFNVPYAGAPPRIEEIGFFVPPPPKARQPGGPVTPIQINHMLVDDRGLIFANDRITGGLYILEYTGSPPLD